MKDNDKGGKTDKALRKNIKYENYKDVILNNKHILYTIRSENHQLGSNEIIKFLSIVVLMTMVMYQMTVSKVLYTASTKSNETTAWL